MRRGTGYKTGESHHRSKVTAAIVREIRSQYLAYVRGYGFFSKRLGLADSTVRDIVQFNTWRHVR